MVSYEPFWNTLKEKNITQYSLVKNYKFSSAQLDRIRKNMYISTRTIEHLCAILNCQPGDIIEVVD